MLEIAVDTAFAVLCLAAAAWDLRARRIPNLLNLAILLGAVVAVLALWVGGVEVSLLSHLLHFAVALAAAMLLFRFKAWGGGDGKFYAALAAWLPFAAAASFAVWTALLGAVLVIVMGLHAKFFHAPDWRKNLPYGVAIAAGGLMTRFGPQIF